MSAAADPNASRPAMMRFRRSRAPRLEPEKARRQGEITQLALLLLGRDKAIEFLNSDNAELGARPLDLATESAAGSASVEAALSRIVFCAAKEA